MTGVIASKIIKRVVSYVVFRLHAQNVCLQRRFRQTEMTHQECVSSLITLFIECAVSDVAPASTCLPLTIFETIAASPVCS